MEEIRKIEDILTKSVRPYLKNHYGDVEVEKFEEGILYIKLLGQCSVCPSATITVEDIVKKQVMELAPYVKDVLLNVSINNELLDIAKQILSKKI